jgi:hypothetical protein
VDVKQPFYCIGLLTVLLCHVTFACAVQIIHVNLTSTEPVALKEGEAVAFTFAVNWLPTVTPFKSRFERYLDYNFFEHKVQLALRTKVGCSNGWNQFIQQGISAVPAAVAAENARAARVVSPAAPCVRNTAETSVQQLAFCGPALAAVTEGHCAAVMCATRPVQIAADVPC